MSLRIRKVDVLLNEKPWLVFIFFTLLVVVLRWSSFYQSAIDWDESLYLLVAKAWLEGTPPYTTIWDNKPPGIYALFSIAISILGHSVLSIRILACLFVAITCFFLYKIGNLIECNGRRTGLLSGSLYAIATLSNGGIGSNTEIFLTTFVVIAFYLFFFINSFHAGEALSKQYLKLFLIGFLLGIGFEIKYVVIFDFLALSLILVITFILQARSNTKYLVILQALSFLLLGFVLPFIIVSLCFWIIGHFDSYIYANFTANKLRTVDLRFSFVAPLKAIFYQIRADNIFWFSMPSVTIYLFVAKTIPTRERWILSSLLVWFFTSLLCICTVLRAPFYPHYFLQLSPSLCLVTAYIIISLVFSGARFEGTEFRQYLILGVLLILLINSTEIFEALSSNAKYVYFRHVKGIRFWSDSPALISEYLKPRIKPNDYIYSVNEPILYFLADAKIPTRYVFPPFLIQCCGVPNITGINPLKELDLIFQKHPVYIIEKKIGENPGVYNENKLFFEKLNQTLDKSYHLENSINESDLFRLNTKP
jgi:4-amino-4-deoxy-L-arabinose transferase-like glycosyltransferase